MASFTTSRNHYFSLPDILVSQERVPITFQRSIRYLGVLDPSDEETTLEAGTSLELPYWLCASLSSEPGVFMPQPLIFSEYYKDIFLADASIVNLNTLNKYYFEFGKLLSYIRPREAKYLVDLLVQTFIDRFPQLSNWSRCTDDLTCENTKRMDSLESCLLERSRKTFIALSSYMGGAVPPIQMAPLVLKHKQRQLLYSSRLFS